MDKMEPFSENVTDFWVPPSVKYLDSPSELQFLRDGVSTYTPVILKNVVTDWGALHKWDLAYLTSVCNEKYSVNVTPDGRADATKKIDGVDCFSYPAEIDMTMRDFCEMLNSRESDDAVPYLSQQDDNLRKHFSHLLADIDNGLPMANAAFGRDGPEATNLWIGDERSTSSLHKDFFENIYVVISGTKTFTLFPPTDVAYFSESTFPTLRYKFGERYGGGRVKQQDLTTTSEGCPFASLPWIDFDPDDVESFARNPVLRRAHPVRCTVRAGEVIYIPAMWYHQVSQTEITIAVNFWYEQRFDFRYRTFQYKFDFLLFVFVNNTI